MTPKDLSNTVTAVVIILIFICAYLATQLPKAKKQDAYRPAKPVLPPDVAITEMTSKIENAQTEDDLKCLEALKANFKEEYAGVFSETKIKLAIIAIADLQGKKLKELRREKQIRAV